MEYKNYEVKIVRKNIKNTYIRVKTDKKISITTSKFTTQKEINKIEDTFKKDTESLFSEDDIPF